MPYLMLIQERGERRTWSLEQARRAAERMMRFRDDLEARGVLATSSSLRPDSEGVRIELRGGKRIVTDGPFAESKEILGGFFILECKSREEAIAIAGACPATEWGTVEVREMNPTCLPDGA